jgi:aminoglycoside phosphotransferase (APT) family kinase protein
MNSRPPPPEAATPKAEVEIDAGLVRALLRAQHPDLAELPIRPADTGWDNVMFRLGDQYALRLPRRTLAAKLIEHEQRWLPELANRLPLPVPSPVRIGTPACGFPWCWSVLPWLKGKAADLSDLEAEQAVPLAAFLSALHVNAPPEAPTNPSRGVPLTKRADAIEARMRRLRGRSTLITDGMERIWQAALATPVDTTPTWIHGDLHARNVLVNDGAISGIIDWGDMAAGDRATDLAAIWMLLSDSAARRQAMTAYGAASTATWRRAKGWAVLFGVVLLDTGLTDHPRHMAMGERTLRHLEEDA